MGVSSILGKGFRGSLGRSNEGHETDHNEMPDITGIMKNGLAQFTLFTKNATKVAKDKTVDMTKSAVDATKSAVDATKSAISKMPEFADRADRNFSRGNAAPDEFGYIKYNLEEDDSMIYILGVSNSLDDNGGDVIVTQAVDGKEVSFGTQHAQQPQAEPVEDASEVSVEALFGNVQRGSQTTIDVFVGCVEDGKVTERYEVPVYQADSVLNIITPAGETVPADVFDGEESTVLIMPSVDMEIEEAPEKAPEELPVCESSMPVAQPEADAYDNIVITTPAKEFDIDPLESTDVVKQDSMYVPAEYATTGSGAEPAPKVADMSEYSQTARTPVKEAPTKRAPRYVFKDGKLQKIDSVL